MLGHEQPRKIETVILAELAEAPVIHAWQDCQSWPRPEEQLQGHENTSEPVLYDYPEYYLG